MKTSELTRKLKQAGYTLAEHRTNHDLWINSQGNTILVPRHQSKEMSKGLANAILKEAGLK